MEITFPGTNSRDASQLAIELRSLLLSHGIAQEVIKLKRTDVEHMDIGDALEVARIGVETILAMHATFSLGQFLHDFAKRNRCTIRIRSDLANIDISTATNNQIMFAEILQKLGKAYHGSRPK